MRSHSWLDINLLELMAENWMFGPIFFLPAGCIEYEDGLQRGLCEGGQRGKECQKMILELEEGSDNAEGCIDKDTSLSHNQQQVV